jgi:Na+/phosphate symporter
MALAGAAREALRMVDVFEAMLRGALDSLNRGDRKRVTEGARMDNVLDRLDTAIKEYVTSLDLDALDDIDHRRLSIGFSSRLLRAEAAANSLTHRCTVAEGPRFESCSLQRRV